MQRRRWASYIPNPYLKRPHARPKNKLRLNNKLIANPRLKYEIINVDESPRKEAKKTKSQKQKHARKGKAKTLTKAESLKIFASILDFI